MDFNTYQELAVGTAIYPNKGTIMGLAYAALGLGEAGEVQGKVKKILRDDNGEITEEKKLQIAYELGDLLWYIAAAASELGIDLDGVAEYNISKLKSRKQRGTLHGSGDNR